VVHFHVLIVPDDAKHRSGQYVQLSGHDLLFPERILANPLPYNLIETSALALFRRPFSTLQSSL